MITLARESRELSQTQLADKLKINQSFLSKIEAGLSTMTIELVDQLSHELGYPADFFYQSGEIYSLGINYYRKTKGLNQKKLVQLNAIINILRLRVQKLLPSIDLGSIEIPFLEVWGNSESTPEYIANIVREKWNIPRGPIDNLTRYLESAGIIIVHLDFTEKGFSAVTIRTENGNYVIFTNKNMPGDRIRFTLAHELGHIIMHSQIPTENMEKEADLFASELLMPSIDIKTQLEYIDLAKLAFLKRRWKVSMAALIMKSGSTNVITENQKRYLLMQMAKMGYKMREPKELDVPIEKPFLFKEIIRVFQEELGYNDEELKKLLFMNEEELYSITNKVKPLQWISFSKE